MAPEASVWHVIDLDFVQSSAAFAFIDFCAVGNRGNDFDVSDASLASTGIGLRARFPLSPSALVTLAIPIDTNPDVADPGTRVFFAFDKAL